MIPGAPATTKLQFDKLEGLIPAIVQEASSGRVLMLGFMNKEAYEESVKRNNVVFWSRSKGRLWQKGETSGNVLTIVSITPDCDMDTLLIRAEASGPVCHLGKETCFENAEAGLPWPTVFERLFRLIEERKIQLPEGSYTTKLFTRGVKKIAQKVGEEAVELAIAAQYEDKLRCIEESADLFYHMLVLLAEKEISLADVAGELERRKR